MGKSVGVIGGGLTGIVVVLAAVVGCGDIGGDARTTEDGAAVAQAEPTAPPSNPLLSQAVSSAARPDGELAELFNLGSENTDIQRQRALEGLKGKVVDWTLPVYEVALVGGPRYKIQTSSGGFREPSFAGTFITLDALTPEEVAFIEALKTDEYVRIKGVITGDTIMRNLVIKPAILEYDRTADLSRAEMNSAVSADGDSPGDGVKAEPIDMSTIKLDPSYVEAFACAKEAYESGVGFPASYCVGNSRDPSEIEEIAYKDAQAQFEPARSLGEIKVFVESIGKATAYSVPVQVGLPEDNNKRLELHLPVDSQTEVVEFVTNSVGKTILVNVERDEPFLSITSAKPL